MKKSKAPSPHPFPLKGEGVNKLSPQIGKGVVSTALATGAFPPAPVGTGIVPASTGVKTLDVITWGNSTQEAKDVAIHRLGIVNKARDIKARAPQKEQIDLLNRLAPDVSYRTINRWIACADTAKKNAVRIKQNTTMAEVESLLPQYGKNTGCRSFHPEALKWAMMVFATQARLNLSEVYYQLINEAKIQGWHPIGSYDSLKRAFDEAESQSALFAARMGLKKWQADYGLKILRNYQEIPVNWIWIGDHHVFDVMVKFNGRVARPWVTAWLDMRSRSVMGYQINFQPNSGNIALALRNGILPKSHQDYIQYGLPSSVYVDNGKDYKCQYLNGEWQDFGKIDYPDMLAKYEALGIDPFYIDMTYDEEDKHWKKMRGEENLTVKGMRIGGVFARLGVSPRYATAYHPWAKTIERIFRNLVQDFSRMQPGWCGSTTDQKPEKLAFEVKSGRLLTAEQLQERFEQYIVYEYHRKPQSGEGMDGMSPTQVFRQLCPEPETVDADILDFALLRQGKVKMNNWGFNLLGEQCELITSSDLEGASKVDRVINQWVEVLYSPDYRTIRVYFNGKYWCDARRYNRASMLEPTKDLSEKLKLQANQRKLVRQRLLEIQSAQATPVIPLFTNQLPKEEENHRLEACAVEEETSEASLSFSAGMEGSSADLQPVGREANLCFLTEQDKYRYLLRKKLNGGALEADDAEFVALYEQSDEYEMARPMWEAETEYHKTKGGMA